MTDDPKSPFNKAGDVVGHKQTHDRGRIDQSMDREAFERDRRIHQTPVSQIELEARKKLRALPKLVLEPTPDGRVNRSDNTSERAENERRIHFLEKRLRRIVGQVRTGFGNIR